MDAYDSLEKKLKAIYVEIAGDKGKAVTANRIAKNVIARIKAIYSKEYGDRTASTLGMHMSDWHSNAAFIVAMHLFPERFTDEEIKTGIGLFLTHAPNHIRAACQITQQYVWENFPDSDPDEWGKNEP